MAAANELPELLKVYTVFHKASFVLPVSYLHPIHAGKTVSSFSLEMEGDNEGENISALNSRMCELTVLYNVWKNKKYLPAQYWGLCHYRRYFSVNIPWWKFKKKPVYDLAAEKGNFNKVFSIRLSRFLLKHLEPQTIILPTPYPIPKGQSVNVREHFVKDHSKSGWDMMHSAIAKLFPEYLESFEAVGTQRKLHLFNMMIAHHTVWDKYLSWLFDITNYVNQHYDFPADSYQSRVIGFMAERLLNVYFFHNKNQYRIVDIPVAVFR